MTAQSDIDRGSLSEVVLVFASGGLSAGKMAGQAAQAVIRALKEPLPNGDEWVRWMGDGTRTIVKVARTEAIFERACAETGGYVMRDEGFTEVKPGTATVLVAGPFLHRDRPKILDNKKVTLL